MDIVLKKKNFIKYVVILILPLLYGLLGSPSVVWGLEYYWGDHPDKERLVFDFSENLPSYQIDRDSKDSISLSLPLDTWERENRPVSRQIEDMDLLQSVNITGDKISINLQTPKFGYTYFRLQDENKLVFDVFRDTLGSNWKKEPTPENPDTKQEQEVLQAISKSTADNEKDAEGNTTLNKQEEQAAKGDKKNKTRQNERTPQSSNKTSGKKQLAARDETKNKSRDSKNGSLTNRSIETSASSEPANNKLIQPVNKSTLTSSKSNKSTHTFLSSINKTLIQPERPPEKTKDKNRSANKTLAASPGNRSGNRSVRTGNESSKLTKRPSGKNRSKSGKNATNASRLKAKLDMAKLALSKEKPGTAKRLFQDVIEHPKITKEQKENILYHLADANFQLYSDNLQGNYSTLVNSLKRAINFDPDSPQVPESILRLMLLNLRTGNIPEAKGYYDYLLENHPESDAIPSAHMYMGNHYLQDSQFNKAAEQFQKIIENHPEYSEIKQAALNLLKTFKEMELYDKGRKIAEYINNKWPRIHLKNPEFLKLAGLVNFKTGNYKKAKDLYWQYYNLNPESPEADIVLTRIGDIYLQTGKKDEAKKMYQDVVSRYPDQDGGLVSKMRLAEEGVHDEPNIGKMFSVFNRPFNLKPLKVYKEIVQEHPNNSLAPLAQLKMAMWYLWRDKSQKALSKVMEFENKFPQSELKERSREVGKKAIQNLVKNAVNEKDFQKAVKLWQNHEYLRQEEQETDPELELAIALSYWKTGNREQAIKMASPYINQEEITKDSENALELLLNIYVNNQSWEDLLALSEDIQAEELTPKLRSQYKYALALANENMDNPEKSNDLWKEVATNKNLSDKQSGYAYYFLAQNALNDKKWEKAYTYAQQSLSTLLDTSPEKDRGKISDNYDTLINVTKNTGRIMEALEWAQRYGDFLSRDSENWPEYRYKLANLYQEAGDQKKWKEVLKKLKENHPQSYYGQMADADLSSSDIAQQASSFLD